MSFHPRRQHNLEQAAILAEAFGKDFLHVTDVYFDPARIRSVGRVFPKIARAMSKRSYSKLPAKSVGVLEPTIELKKMFLAKLGRPLDFVAMSRYWQQQVLKHCQPPEVCISFDTYSSLIFREWKNKSKLVLDLTIGIPQYRIKILHGDAFQLHHLEERDERQKAEYRIYMEEVDLADIVLCGSEFVKKTITFFKPEYADKCKVVNYGVDTSEFSYPEREFVAKEALRFVYVGTVGWRKGADQLLEAWKRFSALHPTAELHFFGAIDSEIDQHHLPPNAFLHGSVPRGTLIGELKKMDVFILPTTFEGSSYAIYQAMAMRLPVITTENSGTVLTHGESCEMVDIAQKDGIFLAMEKLYNDIDYRKKLADRAFSMSSNYTWDDYKVRLLGLLKENFNLP
jgi:glycosyltransferase involved in cell wall biosynthesis